jgi:hypothetical protein
MNVLIYSNMIFLIKILGRKISRFLPILEQDRKNHDFTTHQNSTSRVDTIVIGNDLGSSEPTIA